MKTTLSEISSQVDERSHALRLPDEKTLGRIGLAAILLLAAALLFTNLGAIGYGNTYYTAAVKSMLQSWHNFFFVSAEPGGSVSVDKPPVGFWLQAISAYFLGVNGFAVVLPEIIAGLLSVAVLYHLVRRSFGTVAGLLAALVLAVTPVVVATARNNTIDSTLILTLLLAAWAFIKATESGKFRYLLAGAALVGIGFNIKMLEAYLPLPAFYALYFLGSREGVGRKIGRLAVATLLLLVISLSWAVAVDLTPAGQRPYVGSSGDNSELSLIIGYNGIDRLLGMFGRQGGARNAGQGFQAQAPGASRSFTLPAPGANGGFPGFGGPGRTGGFPQRDGNGSGGGGFTAGGPGGGGGANGFMDTGQAGALRLFTRPLSNEIGWLLPFGLASMLLLALRRRPRWPLTPDHQALVLWGGWLLTAGVFFSIAGFFHPYYLSTLGAPLAGLVAIGAVGLWQLRRQRPWLAFGLLLAAAGGTLAFQAVTAQAFTNNLWWLPLALGLLVAGLILLGVATLRRLPRGALAGFACVMAALLITPGVWSGLTTLSAGGNQTIPAAYSGGSFGFGGSGGLQVEQTLLDYLQQNTQGMKYLMAVPSSMQGAGYVLATGRPVLYMGGFSGQDQVVTGADLASLVAAGQLRYVLLGGGGLGGGNQSDVSSWVTSQCTAVQGLNTSTGSSGRQGGGSLYDCAGQG